MIKLLAALNGMLEMNALGHQTSRHEKKSPFFGGIRLLSLGCCFKYQVAVRTRGLPTSGSNPCFRVWQVLLIGFLFSFPIYSQQVSINGDDLVMDTTQTKWNTSADFSVERSPEKTPDNQNALRFEILPSTKRIIVSGKMAPDFEQTVSALDVPWETLSFWIKPDGSDEQITFVFSASEGGKSSYYSHTQKLLGLDWQKIVIKNLYNKDKQRLALKYLKNIYLYSAPENKASFSLGPVHFTLKGLCRLEQIRTIDIFETSQPPKIDGSLDDECWRQAAFIDKFHGGPATPITVKLCYDKDYIYVGFLQEIDTSLLKKEQCSPDGTVWSDDSLQILFSPGDTNRTYHQFIVNALNTQQTYHYYFDQVKDDFANSRNLYAGKWASAVVVKNNEWAVELRIPRNLMPGLLEKKTHGMQVYICNPSLKQNCFWTETDKAINVVDFGILHLAGPQDAVVPAAGLAAAQLFFQNNEPSILISLDGTNDYAIDAQISTPDGKITSITDTISRCKTLAFKGYLPKTGVQRLVLSLREGSGPSKVFAYKTRPMSFSRQIPYGTEVLLPQPKQMMAREGVCEITARQKIYFGEDIAGETRRTAERLKADLSGFLQIDLPIESVAQFMPNCIVVGEKPDFAPSPESKSGGREDGYALEIGDRGIVLRGASPAGLFYAAVTLSQIERYAFLKNENRLKNVLIEDWPDLPYRIWSSWSDSQYSKYTEKTAGADTPQETLAVHYDYLDRLAIGSKMNFFTLLNSTSVRYENKSANVFSDRNAYMTIKELGDLADYCRNHHVEFVPALNGPSHANWLTGVYKDLIMPGYTNYDANPTDPGFFKQLFLMYSELIGASRPKYFNIWADEWWHKPTGPVSPLHNGREKRDIYLDTILKIHSFFQERNIKMMMFSDMLQREHNGGKPYNNYLNAEKLPRDIIICSWSGGAAAVKYFAELGHASWYIGNRCAQLESEKLTGVKNFTGLGVINYGSMTPDSGYGAAGMIRTADLAWNFWTDSGVSLEDWLYQNGQNVMALFSVRPNPQASSEFVTVDFSTLCNDSYGKAAAGWGIAGLPPGKSTIGFIPSLINPDKDSGNIIRGEEKPAIIPIGLKASALIFLHTQYCPPTKIKEFIAKGSPRNSGSYHGLKTGTYTVNYADNQSAAVYIRNVINCGNWQPFQGRVSFLLDNKYLIDTRYVWEGPKVNGQETCLYQYEWVNPRPYVQIRNIEFSSNSTEATPYLFALTVRKTKNRCDE